MRKLMVVVARFLLFCAVGLSLTQLVSAASFDCNKAKTLVEQIICSNTELSLLDNQVAARYKEALQTTENKESVKTDQRKWLTARNNCKDIECLKKVYVNRISDLDKYTNFIGNDKKSQLSQKLAGTTEALASADNQAENIPARVCSLTGTLPNNEEMRLKATITPLPPKEPDKIRIDYTRGGLNGAIIADLKNRKANQVIFSQDKIEVKKIPFPIANGPVVLIELINFAAGTNIENAKVQDNGCQKVSIPTTVFETPETALPAPSVSNEAIGATTSAPATAKGFWWLRTPQNCSIWAPIDFNSDHILKIESCKDNKAYGKVIVRSNKAEGQEYYFYDGFFISSEKECFADVQAYKPRLHMMPGDPLPLVYIGDISNLSDNELIFKFGAGTTIWVKVSSDFPQMMNDELCNRIFSRSRTNASLFSPVGSVYVLVQNTSKFDDVPASMLERLAVAVTKLVNEKSNNRKYFSFSSESPLITSNYSAMVYIWDEALSNIYASSEVLMSPREVGVRQTRNYVQEAKAAELAKQQEAERKSQINARFDNFLQQAEASKLVQLKDLMANPFRYEGTNIAVQAFYVEMLDRNTSHFQAPNGGFLVVSGLDPGHSMARLTEVLLAGTVTGVYQLHGNLTVPLLTLRSIYVCQTRDCKDIIPN